MNDLKGLYKQKNDMWKWGGGVISETGSASHIVFGAKCICKNIRENYQNF